MLAARLGVELLSIWVSSFVNFVMERSLQTLILLMWAPEGELCQFWFHKQCDQPRSWVSTTMTLELRTNSSTRQSFCSVFRMLLSFSHSSSKIWDHLLDQRSTWLEMTCTFGSNPSPDMDRPNVRNCSHRGWSQKECCIEYAETWELCTRWNCNLIIFCSARLAPFFPGRAHTVRL